MPRLSWSVSRSLQPPLADTHVDFGVIWQRRQRLIQRRMHLCRSTLKESSATWTPLINVVFTSTRSLEYTNLR